MNILKAIGAFTSLKTKKTVELNIVDLDKEDILLSIIVSEPTAKEICNALYKDRKNGGRYSGYWV